MTTNRIAWDVCECGKPGFKLERDVTAYMLKKRRSTEPVDMVECPVGSCFHPFDPTIRNKQAYLNFLVETQVSAKQRRPALPPSRPLTQSLPLGRACVEQSPAPPPPPTPSRASHELRPCAPKVRYGSEAIARFHLASMPEGRREQRVYECTACGDWHLTSHEYAPSQIVEERLVAFGHEPHAITVTAGRYPDGRAASLTIRNAKGSVRVKAENFPQVVTALMAVGALPQSPEPQQRSAKPTRPVRVLEMLADREMTTSEIAASLGVPPSQTRPMLGTMRKSGRIENGTPVVRNGQTVPTWRLPARSACA